MEDNNEEDDDPEAGDDSLSTSEWVDQDDSSLTPLSSRASSSSDTRSLRESPKDSSQDPGSSEKEIKEGRRLLCPLHHYYLFLQQFILYRVIMFML